MERVLLNTNFDFLLKSVLFAILAKKAKGDSVTCSEVVSSFDGKYHIDYCGIEYDVQYILEKLQKWGVIEINSEMQIQLKNLDAECRPTEEEIKSRRDFLTSLMTTESEESKARRQYAAEFAKKARSREK